MSAAVLGIDPGTTTHGIAVLRGGRVVGARADATTEDVLSLFDCARGPGAIVAIEEFEARGMSIGAESIACIRLAGRIEQRARDRGWDVQLIRRSKVKSHLCGTQKAKDGNIRQALIDVLGPPGTKTKPGPTYGVTSHAWAALAVAYVVDANLNA